MDYAFLLAVAPICTAISGAIIGALKIKGTLRQPISWLVSIVVCFIGVYTNLIPALNENLWMSALLEGVAVAAMSNGIADLDFIKKILNLFYGKGSTIVIEAEAPEKDTPMARLMKLQSELTKYITLKDGRVSLTIKDEGNYNKKE